jgi:hypothetical protein
MSAEKKVEIPEDNKEILAYLQGEGDEAPEPGDVRPGFIANRGDSSDNPFPSVVSSVESAGYTTVYNRRTGDTSIINNNMLGQILKKRYPTSQDGVTPEPLAGELVFTIYDPGIRPSKGQFKCYLHKDDPRREEWDSLGLPVCPAGNLASAYHRDRHLSKKHKDEGATIADIDRRKREDEDKADRAEDRRLQREILQQVAESRK